MKKGTESLFKQIELPKPMERATSSKQEVKRTPNYNPKSHPPRHILLQL